VQRRGKLWKKGEKERSYEKQIWTEQHERNTLFLNRVTRDKILAKQGGRQEKKSKNGAVKEGTWGGGG